MVITTTIWRKKETMEQLFTPAADFAASAARAGASSASSGAGSSSMDWKQQKEEQARIRKKQNALKKTEEEIHALETRDQEIDGLLCLEEIFLMSQN